MRKMFSELSFKFQDFWRNLVYFILVIKKKDFETYFTPAFRHPPITGNKDELDDIGLLRELFS